MLRIQIMCLAGHGTFKAHLHKIKTLQKKHADFAVSPTKLLSICSPVAENLSTKGSMKVTLRRYAQFDFQDIYLYMRNTKSLNEFLEFGSGKWL